MANEISASATLNISKNGVTLQHTTSVQHDMAGDEMVHRTQSIGTSAEQVSFGDISGAPGMVKFTNLDATNFIELALDSGMTNKIAKLRPGGVALFQPSSGTIYAKADTAACRLLVQASEL
jgi:hypothetical protein